MLDAAWTPMMPKGSKTYILYLHGCKMLHMLHIYVESCFKICFCDISTGLQKSLFSSVFNLTPIVNCDFHVNQIHRVSKFITICKILTFDYHNNGRLPTILSFARVTVVFSETFLDLTAIVNHDVHCTVWQNFIC